MKTIHPMKLAARLGIYCLGLLILAFGIALAVNSKLGVSPVSSLPYVASLITNISLGTCTTVIYGLYLLLQGSLLLDRDLVDIHDGDGHAAAGAIDEVGNVQAEAGHGGGDGAQNVRHVLMDAQQARLGNRRDVDDR